jgi:hypothetical protein
MIPELTRSVGVPRLAGIAYPLGSPMGRPHDEAGQRAVLRAMLELLPHASGPDTYVELPFEWPEPRAQAINASKPDPLPPIAQLLLKKPWLVPRLYTGQIPDGDS